MPTASDLPGTSQRRSSAPVQVPVTKNVVQQQAEKFKQGMQSLLKPEKERRRRAEERVSQLIISIIYKQFNSCYAYD